MTDIGKNKSDTEQYDEIIKSIEGWIGAGNGPIVKLCNVDAQIKSLTNTAKIKIVEFLKFLKDKEGSVKIRECLELDLIKDGKFQKGKVEDEREELNVYRSVFFDLDDYFNQKEQPFMPKFGITFDPRMTPEEIDIDGTTFKYGVIKLGEVIVYYCLCLELTFSE